jgi:penicillin-insensitive murein endopeptidase
MVRTFAGKEGVLHAVQLLMRVWIACGVLIASGCAGAATSASTAETETTSAAPVPEVVVAEPIEQAAPTAEPSVAVSETEASEVEGEGEGEGEGDVEGDVEITAATSTSIGGPNEGRLVGGVALPTHAPGLRSNPRRPNAEAYFGTYELIHSLVDAAAIVRRELPGGELTINDIGFREGGTITHHGSHRAGRDVDVLFYMLDLDGAPRRSLAVPIEPDGHGTDFLDLHDPADDVDVRLDVPRTWRLVRALLEDDAALVQRIFVVEHVRTMLLAEAARVHAPRRVVRRFEDVSCQPSYPHDDHLHVRYFCTTEDLAGGCEDASPIYPWRRDQLEAAGVEPVLAHPRRHPSEPTVEPELDPTIDEAARAFLTRREAWATQPHPGRPYCR